MLDAVLNELARRRPASFDDCSDLSPLCPVEATVLGYVPNRGSSIFFALAFGLLCISSVGLGVWKKTWTYAATLGVGLLLETLGKTNTRRYLTLSNTFIQATSAEPS